MRRDLLVLLIAIAVMLSFRTSFGQSAHAANPLVVDFSFPPATASSPVTFTPTASGGASPYSYSWNIPSLGITLTGNPATLTWPYYYPGSWLVELTVTDSLGNTAVASHTVDVGSYSTGADFSLPSAITTGSPAVFSVTVPSSSSCGGQLAFDWGVGDAVLMASSSGVVDFSGFAAAGSSTPLTHIFSAAGNYTVVLRVTDSGSGCPTPYVSYASHFVTVLPSSILVDFSFPPATASSPVTFTATTSGGAPPYSYSWSIPSLGITLTGNPVSQTWPYYYPGSWLVSVTVTDSVGNVAVASHIVNVGAYFAGADFSVPTSVTTGSPSAFLVTTPSSSSCGQLSFDWGVGDAGLIASTSGLVGFTSFAQAGSTNSLTYTFSAAGNYTVVLRVTDTGSGCATPYVSYASHFVTVLSSPILVDFSWTPITAGSPAVLTATASGGSPSYSFSWSIPNVGVTLTGNPVTYSFTYYYSGSFLVMVTVTDSLGHVAVASHIVNVGSYFAGADFSIPTVITTRSPATFVVTVPSSSSCGGQPAFDWAVGNAALISSSSGLVDFSTFTLVGSSNPLTHSFSAAGNYTLVLRVVDSGPGCSTPFTSYASHLVTVTSSTILVDFSWTPITAGSSAVLTATASGGSPSYSFSWTIPGLGSYGYLTGNPVTSSFYTCGYYSCNYVSGPNLVMVTVTDSLGNVAVASHIVNVEPFSTGPSFSIPSSLTSGSPGDFSASLSSHCGVPTFDWGVGDASLMASSGLLEFSRFTAVGTGNPLTYAFSLAGNYTLVLRVTDSGPGCATPSISYASYAVTVLQSSVTVDFSWTPVTAGSPALFTATVLGGSPSYSFSWTIPGLGSYGYLTGNPVTSSFYTCGYYSCNYVSGPNLVMVTVTDSLGNVAVASHIVNVGSYFNGADFSVPSAITTGSPADFSATVTSSPFCGGQLSFDWGVGDAALTASSGLLDFSTFTAVGSGKTLTNIFPIAGNYAVVLRVVDMGPGCATPSTSYASHFVTVLPSPVLVDFSFSPAIVNVPVTFTATASGGSPPYSFSWYVTGFGATLTGNPVDFTFTSPGPWIVVLTVTDFEGNMGVASHAVGAFDFRLSSPSLTELTVVQGSTSLSSSIDAILVSGAAVPVTFSAYSLPNGVTATFTNNPCSPTCTVTVSFSATFTATVGAATVTISATDGSVYHSIILYLTVEPVIPVTVNCDSATSGKPVTCTASAAGGSGSFDFSWSAPNGSPSTGTGSTFTTTFATKGSQTISVTATDTNGLIGQGSMNVGVTAQTLTADFGFAPTTPSSGEQVSFTASATGGTEPYSFTWDFGDGSTGGGPSVNHSYTVGSTQTLTVTMTAIDANSRAAIATHAITVSPVPIQVSIICGTATAGKPVSCDASATGGTQPFTFTWSAPNGTPSTGTGDSFTTTYSTKGSYTVTATATDSTSATAPGSARIIVGPQSLTTNFTFVPTTPFSGRQVTFTATATGGTLPYTFIWDFGDTTTGAGTSVGHTYTVTSTTTFQVTLTAKDANDVALIATHDLTVIFITINVAVTCESATAGKPVTCSATSSDGVPPVTFTWSSPSSSPSAGSGESFTTTFAAKGTATITASGTDADGTTGSDSAQLTIAPQALSVTATCGSATAGKPVTCNATVAGGTSPYSFTWSSNGNPSTGTGSSYTTRFATKGGQTVTVIVTDTNSISQQRIADVTVVPQSFVPDFTFSPAGPAAGQLVTFAASATGGTSPYTFSWDFGDLGSGTGSPTSHTYAVTTTTTFHVVLTATDSNSVTATSTHDVTVSPVAIAVTVTCSSATAGKPVTCTATASGGTGTFTFSWSALHASPPTGSGSSFTTSPSIKGDNTITAAATDSNGATGSGQAVITVSPQPLTITIIASSGATAGKPVTFTSTVTGGTEPYSASWDFGDSTSGTGTETTHSYPTKGTYTVGEVVTDANGATSNALPVGVPVTAQPLVSDFTASNSSPGIGETVNFDGTASGGTTAYQFTWDFGDGSSDTGQSVTHAYTTLGVKTVILTVTDSNGATTTPSHTITVAQVFPLCNQSVGGCDFNFDPTSPTVGKPVTFTATAHGGIGPYTFSWNFGDGSPTSTLNPVIHMFTSADTSQVVLTISDGEPPVPAPTVSHAVTVVEQPIGLNVVVACGTATAGKPVTCDATATGGAGGNTFTWTVDGTLQAGHTSSSFTATFATKGTHTIRSDVTDSSSATDFDQATVAVAGQQLQVGITLSPAVTAGKPVSFSTTIIGGTSPYTVTWDFGDGGDGSGESATHVYAVKGTFDVIVSVRDANNALASAPAAVTVVSQPLSVDFTISNPNPQIGDTVNFEATASGGTVGYSFDWNFGDSTSGTGASAQHSFAVKGSYTISVTVTDANGATAPTSHGLTVIGQPLIVTSITASPAQPTQGDPTTFTAAIQGGTAPYSASWDFGDGSSSSTNPATHVYANAGPFTVLATASDANGANSAPFTVNINITPRELIVDFRPTHSVVGNTDFVAVITGGTSPFTCSWNFGDGSPSQTGCNVTHNYKVAGAFGATLSVTDNGAASSSKTKNILVDQPPRLIRGKVHWTHHLSGGTGATLRFIAKAMNPSSFTLQVTLTVNIFDDAGNFIATTKATESLPAGTTDLAFTATWTPTLTGKFVFTASLSYSLSLGDLSGDGVQEMLAGTDGSKSGTFTVVP